MKKYFKISIFRFWSMRAPCDVENQGQVQVQVQEEKCRKEDILPLINTDSHG